MAATLSRRGEPRARRVEPTQRARPTNAHFRRGSICRDAASAFRRVIAPAPLVLRRAARRFGGLMNQLCPEPAYKSIIAGDSGSCADLPFACCTDDTILAQNVNAATF